MSSGNEARNLLVTEGAINKIHQLIQQEQDPSMLLRVSVIAGGCSGFQYDFKLDSLKLSGDDEDDYEDEYEEEIEGIEDEEDEEDDEDEMDFKVFDNNGRAVLVMNKSSSELLQNAVIDYIEDINGSGFIVTNPIAKTRCGCGNSFSI